MKRFLKIKDQNNNHFYYPVDSIAEVRHYNDGKVVVYNGTYSNGIGESGNGIGEGVDLDELLGAVPLVVQNGIAEQKTNLIDNNSGGTMFGVKIKYSPCGRNDAMPIEQDRTYWIIATLDDEEKTIGVVDVGKEMKTGDIHFLPSQRRLFDDFEFLFKKSGVTTYIDVGRTPIGTPSIYLRFVVDGTYGP